METVKVDAKGRLSIPSSVRSRVQMNAGDTYFIKTEKTGVIRLAKARNPFDEMAIAAIEEYEAGNTINLRDFAEREGIDLDDE